MSRLKVTLCLGSSCHSRGNRHHVQTLRQQLADHALAVEIELKGSLCLGRCSEGPMVLFDDQPVVLREGDDLATLVRERLDARVPL